MRPTADWRTERAHSGRGITGAQVSRSSGEGGFESELDSQMIDTGMASYDSCWGWRSARLSSSCRSSEALITCAQVRSPSSFSFRRPVYVSDLGFVPKSKSGPHVNTNPKPHQITPAPVMEDTATADSLQSCILPSLDPPPVAPTAKLNPSSSVHTPRFPSFERLHPSHPPSRRTSVRPLPSALPEPNPSPPYPRPLARVAGIPQGVDAMMSRNSSHRPNESPAATKCGGRWSTTRDMRPFR